jgi:cytoskeletal protein RodZ
MAGFGETLHQARAHLGVTLKEAEQATRINRHHLAALEDENFAALPPLIYQRGIVRNYASYLQLDPGKLLAMFEEAHGAGDRSSASTVLAVPPVNMPSHWAPNFAVISFALVLSAIISAWVYSAFVAKPDIDLTPTIAVPTATPFESDIPVPTRAPTQVPPTEEPTQAPEPTQSSSAGSRAASDEDGQPRGGDNQRAEDEAAAEGDEAATGSIEVVVTEAVASDESSQASSLDETELTSISVTANAEIDVMIVADGEVVFEGTLAAGESSGFVTGNTFEVDTSWGEQTIFTDACGGDFMMGYETGSASYLLQKDDNSCPPIG